MLHRGAETNKRTKIIGIVITVWSSDRIKKRGIRSTRCHSKPTQPRRVVVKFEKCLTTAVPTKLIIFLKDHIDCVAWSHEDMVGISPKAITHRLTQSISHLNKSGENVLQREIPYCNNLLETHSYYLT